MIRIFATLFIIFSAIANACDQPYEEIDGVKIGCPIELNKWFEETDANDSSRTAQYSYDIWDRPVSDVSVTTLDNNIEYVIFNLRGLTEEDYQGLLASMEKKWGASEEFIPSQAEIGNFFGKLPGILEFVHLISYDGSDFQIHYQSKKIADYWKEKRIKEEFGRF